MSNPYSPGPLNMAELKSSLRQCCRFTLRTLLILTFLAALAGLATQSLMGWIDDTNKSFRRWPAVGDAEERLASPMEYNRIVEDWYKNRAGVGVVDRHEMDVIMSKALPLDPDAHLAELEGLSGERRKGDTVSVFSLSDPAVPGTAERSEPSHLYAFLIRDGWLIYFAERKPGDNRWVEQSAWHTYYDSKSSKWLRNAAIPMGMVLFLSAFFVIRVLVVLFRYFRAPLPGLAAGKKKHEGTMA